MDILRAFREAAPEACAKWLNERKAKAAEDRRQRQIYEASVILPMLKTLWQEHASEVIDRTDWKVVDLEITPEIFEQISKCCASPPVGTICEFRTDFLHYQLISRGDASMNAKYVIEAQQL